MCPGLVKTNIIERDHLGLDLDESSIDQHESAKNNAQWLADGVKDGMSTKDLAALINCGSSSHARVNTAEVI